MIQHIHTYMLGMYMPLQNENTTLYVTKIRKLFFFCFNLTVMIFMYVCTMHIKWA